MCYTSRAVSGSKVGVDTDLDDNPAYTVSDPHGNGDQTEYSYAYYEVPDVMSSPPAQYEDVYEYIIN